MDETNKKVTGLGLLEKLAQDFKDKLDATNGQVEALAAAGEPINAAVGRIEDSMYQVATCTKYTKATSVTGAMTDATVGSLVDDDTLAALTPAGTDGAGNNQYDFMINGVKTGTYTKNTALSAVLDGINSSETGGVNVSYDQETGSFVFTARKAGKDYRIEMGEGLADAMFGPPEGSDRSGESFASVVLGVDLPESVNPQIKVVLPGKTLTTNITKADTVNDVLNDLGACSMGTVTFSWNKYTGWIEARDHNGVLLDMTIQNQGGTEYGPSESSDFYTYGRDAIFTAIEVNGNKIPVSGKTVSISVPKRVSQMENDSKFQTEDQVAATINAKVSSTYKAGGSVAFAALPTPDEAHLGFVYNVTDNFTTTDSFVEGVGKTHPAGTNVAIVAVTDGETTSYKYDALAGFVDLSGYDTTEQTNTKLAGKVDKEDGKGLSTEDFTTAHKSKLDGIEFATEADYNAMINRVFGTEAGS